MIQYGLIYGFLLNNMSESAKMHLYDKIKYHTILIHKPMIFRDITGLFYYSFIIGCLIRVLCLLRVFVCSVCECVMYTCLDVCEHL